MSSPLSSLKKGKKTPLRNNVPYRNSFAFTSDKTEEELFDDIDIPNSFLKREIVNKVSKPTNKGSSTAASSDTQLLTTMAARLAQTEQQLKVYTREIIEKDRKIKILEEKVHLLERARNYGSDNIQELEKKCQLLAHQVHDMEMFLADYGMVWVGDSEEPVNDEKKFSSYVELSEEEPTDLSNSSTSTLLNKRGVWQQDMSVGVSDFQMDFDLVVQNIQELNILANEGSSKIQHKKGGARLKVQEAIPLSIYSNGILMFNGPFRPYTDPSTQNCMQDVMDGFFPSELQQRYPDGVPFQLTDRREIVYKDRTTELLFPGEGQSMKNQNDSSNRKEATRRIGSGQKLSMEQFLSKLPQSVVKNGKIVDVRSGVAETIQGNSGKNSVTVIETKVIQDMKERADQNSLQNVTTLRIKSEGGDEVYILKMKFTDTIRDVRDYLDKQRDLVLPDYDIKTSFPNKVYDDPKSTLEECGLVPNATLHLLVRK